MIPTPPTWTPAPAMMARAETWEGRLLSECDLSDLHRHPVSAEVLHLRSDAGAWITVDLDADQRVTSVHVDGPHDAQARDAELLYRLPDDVRTALLSMLTPGCIPGPILEAITADLGLGHRHLTTWFDLRGAQTWIVEQELGRQRWLLVLEHTPEGRLLSTHLVEGPSAVATLARISHRLKRWAWAPLDAGPTMGTWGDIVTWAQVHGLKLIDAVLSPEAEGTGTWRCLLQPIDRALPLARTFRVQRIHRLDAHELTSTLLDTIDPFTLQRLADRARPPSEEPGSRAELLHAIRRLSFRAAVGDLTGLADPTLQARERRALRQLRTRLQQLGPREDDLLQRIEQARQQGMHILAPWPGDRETAYGPQPPTAGHASTTTGELSAHWMARVGDLSHDPELQVRLQGLPAHRVAALWRTTSGELQGPLVWMDDHWALLG